MNWNKVVEEFQVRYYYWALEDFNREIKDGFPYLQTFKCGPAQAAFNVLSSLDLDEMLLFAKALTKRFHRRAVEILAEPITETEMEICKGFRIKVLEETPQQLTYAKQPTNEAKVEFFGRSKLRRCIKRELQQVNMKEDNDPSAAMLRYETRINDWDILTDIDLSGTYPRIIYHHSILPVDRPQIVHLKSGENARIFMPLVNAISLNSWLGISSQTEWTFRSEVEAKQVAECLANLCSHFINNAENLLKGLSVD